MLVLIIIVIGVLVVTFLTITLYLAYDESSTRQKKKIFPPVLDPLEPVKTVTFTCMPVNLHNFKASHEIETPEFDFVGEFGLSAVTKVNKKHVAPGRAFELWMFDKQDIRTESRFLVSEGLFYELMDEFSRPADDIIMASPDTTFVLETKMLRMVARVVEEKQTDSGELEKLVVKVAIQHKMQ